MHIRSGQFGPGVVGGGEREAVGWVEGWRRGFGHSIFVRNTKWVDSGNVVEDSGGGNVA